MQKKLILITGSSKGIGFESAKELAKMGYKLVLACRDTRVAKEKAEQIILETSNTDIEIMQLDLSSFELIDKFIYEFTSKYDHIDVLINNAGVFSDRLVKTSEGYELTMAVNYLGHYYLTKSLLERLQGWSDARIINAVSKAAYFGKLNIKKDFIKKHPHGFKGYSASKLAEVMMTIHLSEKLASRNITVNAAHPGEVATDMWKGDTFAMKLIGLLSKKRYDSAENACKTIVYLASSHEIYGISGKLFEKENEIMQYNKRILDRKTMNELIKYTDDLIGNYRASKSFKNI